MSNIYRGSTKDASYQISIHLQAISEKIFRDQPIRNKNGLWWPCLLADRDEMTNLHRGPARCFLTSFGSFAKRFQSRFKKNQPMRKKNCLCRPCL